MWPEMSPLAERLLAVAVLAFLAVAVAYAVAYSPLLQP